MSDPTFHRHRALAQWTLAWVVVAILFLSAIRSSALDPSRTIYQYSCRSWDRQSGLPANGINAILQTPDGYIWLGTAMGLVRFDGSEFKLFDMPHNAPSAIVSSVANAQSGGLWFGLGNGAFGYCDGDIVSFRGREDWGGLNLNVHTLLEDTNGDLWIGAQTQLGRLTRDNRYESRLTGKTATERYDFTVVARGSQGRVWLGTSLRGLYVWQNGALTKYPDPALDELTIRSITEDAKGQLWLGTHAGLICYDTKGKRAPLPFPWYETTALLADRNGMVWVGTSGGGLMRFAGGTAYSQLSRSNGLADNFITALAEDREGSLWVGTRRGLNQISDVKIPTFGKNEELPSEVNVGVSASPRYGLWIAGSDSLTFFDGWGHPQYSTNLGLAHPYIKCALESRNGDIYIGDGNQNIDVVVNGKTIASYTNRSWPMGMTEDEHGVVAAVGAELYRVGRDYYQPYPFADGRKPAFGWIFNVVSDPAGALWVSCDAGICRVQGDTFRMWTTNDGLPKSAAMWVTLDEDGVAWTGFQSGMARIKDGKARSITRADGLFDNMIYAIVPDDYGFLWVDSSRGIFKVSRQSLNAFCDGTAKHVDCVAFDGLDAVKSDEKIQYMQSGCKTRDGRIWFPSAEGILMIEPTNIFMSQVPPEVHIQVVKANGKHIDRARPNSIRPGKGDLEFQYSGLSFINPKKIQYRYQLVGYDSDWVAAENRRSAFYTNLKPGKYHFRVQACNADGIWSTAATASMIELEPHFYQTGWFIALIVISVFGSVGAMWFGRMQHIARKHRQLQQAHDLLEAKVNDRTAELAASNLSLTNEIEERKRAEMEVERTHRELMHASRTAGQAEVASSVLHNVGNVLNSVNVAASIATDRVRAMRVENLRKAAKLIQENQENLHQFLTEDRRGKRLPEYLSELSDQFADQQKQVLKEINELSGNIDHIKEIVSMQQNYARVLGVKETFSVAEVVEGALKMHVAAFRRHSVRLVREFEEVPPVTVDRHKVLQILVNLLHNAKYACDDSPSPHKQVTVRIRKQEELVSVDVMDNGVGIPAENMTRIFSHGFTTRKNGHGFGLHSSAIAAKELGGNLTAHSEGPGQGAMFSLELPAQIGENL